MQNSNSKQLSACIDDQETKFRFSCSVQSEINDVNWVFMHLYDKGNYDMQSMLLIISAVQCSSASFYNQEEHDDLAFFFLFVSVFLVLPYFSSSYIFGSCSMDEKMEWAGLDEHKHPFLSFT